MGKKTCQCLFLFLFVFSVYLRYQKHNVTCSHLSSPWLYDNVGHFPWCRHATVVNVGGCIHTFYLNKVGIRCKYLWVGISFFFAPSTCVWRPRLSCIQLQVLGTVTAEVLTARLLFKFSAFTLFETCISHISVQFYLKPQVVPYKITSFWK